MISERLGRLEKALANMRLERPLVVVEVPVRLVNTSNGREYWRATAKRAKTVRSSTTTVVRAAMNSCAYPTEAGLVYTPELGEIVEMKPLRDLVSLGRVPLLSIRLVYVGPRQLDDDGVASAVKSLRDGVADALGIDDRDPRVVWVPDQERGGVREYSARVEVYLAR